MKTKQAPLSEREKYMMRKLRMGTIVSYIDKWKSEKRTRTPSEFRRILRHRRENPKYAFVKEAYERMKKAIAEKEDVQTATYALYNALKYQGYIQVHIIELEDKLEGLTDKQIKLLTLAEGI